MNATTLTAADRIQMAARMVARSIARKGQVIDKARGTTTKVFLAEIMRMTGITAEQIIAEHQAGRIVLSRCDLVSAYDQAAFKASQIAHLNATFHFVTVA